MSSHITITCPQLQIGFLNERLQTDVPRATLAHRCQMSILGLTLVFIRLSCLLSKVFQYFHFKGYRKVERVSIIIKLYVDHSVKLILIFYMIGLFFKQRKNQTLPSLCTGLFSLVRSYYHPEFCICFPRMQNLCSTVRCHNHKQHIVWFFMLTNHFVYVLLFSRYLLHPAFLFTTVLERQLC